MINNDLILGLDTLDVQAYRDNLIECGIDEEIVVGEKLKHFKTTNNLGSASETAIIAALISKQLAAKPSDEYILAGYSSQAEYDAQEYARNRKAKYDALNQFELISDDSINGTTTHKDAILAIKAKYPKPD